MEFWRPCDKAAEANILIYLHVFRVQGSCLQNLIDDWTCFLLQDAAGPVTQQHIEREGM